MKNRFIHVQRSHGGNVPLDHLLTRLHLGEEGRVADDAGRILDLAARLVKTGDCAHDGPFEDVGEIGDQMERHAPGPLVHDLDESEARAADEVVRVRARQDDLVLDLERVDPLRDRYDRVSSL